MIRHLKTAKTLAARAEEDAKVRASVEAILADISARADYAVRELSIKFDKYAPKNFRLSEQDIATAMGRVSKRDLDDIRFPRRRCAILRKTRKRPCAT